MAISGADTSTAPVLLKESDLPEAKQQSWEKLILIQVILTYWLVLAYDLLEHRHAIDIIITKFILMCFKMAESFEN